MTGHLYPAAVVRWPRHPDNMDLHCWIVAFSKMVLRWAVGRGRMEDGGFNDGPHGPKTRGIEF